MNYVNLHNKILKRIKIFVAFKLWFELTKSFLSIFYTIECHRDTDEGYQLCKQYDIKDNRNNVKTISTSKVSCFK